MKTRTLLMLTLLASGVLTLGSDVSATEPCTKAGAQHAISADRRTTEEVERRIAGDESVGALALQVKVATSDGVVTLRGVIAHDEDRMVLASLAESAPGVRRVDDRLEVR